MATWIEMCLCIRIVCCSLTVAAAALHPQENLLSKNCKWIIWGIAEVCPFILPSTELQNWNSFLFSSSLVSDHLTLLNTIYQVKVPSGANWISTVVPLKTEAVQNYSTDYFSRSRNI